MTPLAAPVFELVALAVSTAILLLAVGFAQALVAQALECPYRLRQPAPPAPVRLRPLPSGAAPRTARPRFAKRELPGAA